MKYFISYLSSIVTVINAGTIFWIIRLTSSTSSNREQLAELIFLVGLFPVVALGYPTAIIAEVSRTRKLDRFIVRSAYFYMCTSSLLVCTICFIFFNEVWWVSGAYPLIFIISVIRGYFEAFEKFWLSATSKLFVSSVLLASATQLVINEFPPQLFVIVCIGLSVLLMFQLYRKSEYDAWKNFNLSRYSIQAIVVLSFIFMDRLLMKFIADSETYVAFIITQEALYKILSLFMLMSVFHFPELNSASNSIRLKGLNAYKLQLLSAFFLLLFFVFTPLNELFFGILRIEIGDTHVLMLPALFLPIMSMFLQKFALSQIANGLVRVFVYTVAGSSAIGGVVTYILEDPIVSMASRGAIEVIILLYFIRRNSISKEVTD